MSDTFTEDFTVIDVDRVLDQFAADLAMYADSTNLWTPAYAGKVAADVTAFAEAGYLAAVTVHLRDARGRDLRAATYEVNTNAVGLAATRPGGAMWPDTPGGTLDVVVSYTAEWRRLPASRKESFRSDLQLGWGLCNTDTSFPGLVRTADRSYVSNGYGLNRSTFK
jgi:hypothetical protein